MNISFTSRSSKLRLPFEKYLNTAYQQIMLVPRCFVFEMFCISISGLMAGVLMESIHSFSQSLQENVRCDL